jgi:hypothetical protein
LMRHRPPFFGGEVGGTGKDEESERENWATWILSRILDSHILIHNYLYRIRTQILLSTEEKNYEKPWFLQFGMTCYLWRLV